MKRNILMVYPQIPNTYWGFKYALPFVGRKAVMPPLGLMTVASLLPSDYYVRLVDMNVKSLNPKDIEWADMVFISAMIVQKESFEHVVRLSNVCNKPVVAGGPYPTTSCDSIRGVDHFVLDEAESTLPAFLKDLESGKPQKIYRSPQKPDIHGTPVPRFDVIEAGAYNVMPLQYSRGCPFNCEFCDIIELFGRKVRTKTPEQFIAEIEAVYRTGYRGTIFIVDDNFVGNKKSVKQLLNAIIAWQKLNRKPFLFSTEASINLAQDDELLNLMVNAGFKTVFVGIETPDEKTLAFTQKKQNLKVSVLEAVKKIQTRGIEVTGGFILGFDTDPEDIFDRQIGFIQKAGIAAAMMGLLTALPNTQLHRRLALENRLVHDSSGNNTHDMKLNFRPRMAPEKLVAGYKRVIAEIYSPRKYFRRCLTFLRRLPANSRSFGRIASAEIRALLLSLVKQTFSYYGACYLRYLMRAMLFAPRHMAAAIGLAVTGYHFIKLTKEIISADALSIHLIRTIASIQGNVKDLVVAGGKSIVELERHVLMIRNNLQRRYSRLSGDVQEYLKDIFVEFETRCEEAISELRLHAAAI